MNKSRICSRMVTIAARIVIEPLSPAGREAVANRQTGKE